MSASAHPPRTEPVHPADGRSDPAAAKRAQARHEKVTAGLAELQIWLVDQVRAGLAALPQAGYGHFDTVAARMVDAQAPGVAGVLRSMPAELTATDWPERTLTVLGGLYLLTEAHRRLDRLPDDLAATICSRVGYPVSKEQVRTRPAVTDRWWALAAVDEVAYQLTSRRVWLRGLDTGRWAMWLTFAPPGRELDTSIQPSGVYACPAHFYPGSGQYRALIEPPLPQVQPADVAVRVDRPGDAELLARTWHGDDLVGVGEEFAALLAVDPWASRLPVVLRGIPQAPRGGAGWRIRDLFGAVVPLLDVSDGWPLIAQSGGESIELMGEYDGRGLRPLAVLPDARGRRYEPVATSMTGASR
ncbi:MAG: hypothetical protein L0H41_09810 [Microlunatus sp.]|nr:hypothetical protein [Microlunatus sp.]MDN5771442.1 hypothetical protein [Microlunatus sp.]MDN5804855.1 hypothetical protein [Microlunatus sp.]